ncbi:hypothetical protein KBD49_09955 [Myxococcota bacterium]|nr:hypothetical protein [Myxococcota bacterium]
MRRVHGGFLVLALACSSPAPMGRDDSSGPAWDVRVPPADDGGDLPGSDGRDPDVGDPGGTDPAGEAGEVLPGEDRGPLEDTPETPEDPGPGPGDVLPEVLGSPIPRTCEAILTWKGQASSVTVPGDWNGWDTKAHPMTRQGTGDDWEVRIDLSSLTPGTHQYKILRDGTGWMTDPANPLTAWDASRTNLNSKMVVPDCRLPELRLVAARTDWSRRSVEADVEVRTGIGGESLVLESIRVDRQGTPVPFQWDAEGQRILVRLADQAPGKHSLTFRVSTSRGAAEPLFVPIWLEQKPFDWRDAVLYFAMTDRFANGDPANDGGESCVPRDQACRETGWVGGDWKGIRQRIEEGWFDRIGVSAIWISAANDNPDGCMEGDLSGVRYTAYHGYFPLSLDATENHFGTMEDLQRMVQAAHARGIRVLMDLDANHVHEDSPLWKERPEWFHRTPRICGQDDNWNQHPVDCWFQAYLPDLDYRVDEAVEAVTESAIQWAIRADLDGFRVDAVKHMDHSFGLHLRAKVRQRLEHGITPFWLVGETFVGDWAGGAEGSGEAKIREYVSDRELTGQFHFPLYWAIVSALARGESSVRRMVEIARDSQAYWRAGWEGSVMSNFLGNHDIPRFVTHADPGRIADQWGNGSKELCRNPPPQPASPDPYLRMRQAFAFLMTIPGVPLIYYGDEIGLAGGGDPDNRRPMVFEGFSADQAAVRDAVGALATFRALHPSTRRGTLTVLAGETDWVAYGVSIGTDDPVLVVLNRGESRTVQVPLGEWAGLPASGTWVDGLGGGQVAWSGGSVSVEVPRLGFRLLARP